MPVEMPEPIEEKEKRIKRASLIFPVMFSFFIILAIVSFYYLDNIGATLGSIAVAISLLIPIYSIYKRYK